MSNLSKVSVLSGEDQTITSKLVRILAASLFATAAYAQTGWESKVHAVDLQQGQAGKLNNQSAAISNGRQGRQVQVQREECQARSSRLLSNQQMNVGNAQHKNDETSRRINTIQ
jgi:hypothetical protein